MSVCVKVNGMRTSRFDQPDRKYYDYQRVLHLATAEQEWERFGL